MNATGCNCVGSAINLALLAVVGIALCVSLNLTRNITRTELPVGFVNILILLFFYTKDSFLEEKRTRETIF